MHRRYYFLITLLLLLTIGLLFLPDNSNIQDRQPLELAQALNNDARYLSCDQVASRIIRNDPTLLLVDVRDSGQFNAFALEGAVNVPLNSILNPENKSLFSTDATDVVFYSNGDLLSEKAWIIAYRKGYNNLFIMRGGLNQWSETILNPKKPLESASRADFDLYQFRLAAGIYFRGGEVSGGDSITTSSTGATTLPKEKKPLKVAAPQKNTESEGGC